MLSTYWFHCYCKGNSLWRKVIGTTLRLIHVAAILNVTVSPRNGLMSSQSSVLGYMGATLARRCLRWRNPFLRFLSIIFLKCVLKELKSRATITRGTSTSTMTPVVPIAMFFVSLSAFVMPIAAITFSACVFGSSSSGTNIVTFSPVAVGQTKRNVCSTCSTWQYEYSIVLSSCSQTRN